MSANQDWLDNFVITVDDLKRLEEWLTEQKRGVTLEDLTRRVIRGRLLFGEDSSPSALPQWVQEKNVLSWDEEEKWQVGSQVLVGRHNEQSRIVPYFGVITAINDEVFYIKIGGDIVKYAQVKPNSKAAKNRYEKVKDSILRREREQQTQSMQASLNEKIDVVLLKNGAQIASTIQNALKMDQRFLFWKNKWYLQNWISEIPFEALRYAHRQLIKTIPKATLTQLRDHIPGLPDGELGELSLRQALGKAVDLFQSDEDGWQAIPPAPPPWEKAVGAYYAYDPDTYRVLIAPGERLTKRTAQRLQELGLYDQLVVPADESRF